MTTGSFNAAMIQMRSSLKPGENIDHALTADDVDAISPRVDECIIRVPTGIERGEQARIVSSKRRQFRGMAENGQDP